MTHIGKWSFVCAENLVVVDIPEGVEIIGRNAFMQCRSLTKVSFTTTLCYIGESSLKNCLNLLKVDLLHTKLEVLCDCAFWGRDELKSMTVAESLGRVNPTRSIGTIVFYRCNKLVPKSIDISDYYKDTTLEVIDHLCELQWKGREGWMGVNWVDIFTSQELYYAVIFFFLLGVVLINYEQIRNKSCY
ncbi:hypothetical protein TL16_g00889 [Triparma laevis f. inornata]|uniref:Uncharacterized protein n=1 Tax=Triparma laevis f. inornata TaxID=1714386 RepID=A0A9W6ZIE4_9STRA|nr:hypothetical protein TL16_g00889 [Triparma laevis f. inornata]